jgi:D-lactate dehydrogenase
MHIAIFETDEKEKAYLSQKLKDHSLSFYTNPIKPDDLAQLQDIEVLVTFIYSRVTSDVINALPNLKCVATMSTGFDHIDLEACKQRNIIVTNVPSYGEVTVAEHTFALMLAVSRRLIESYARVKDGYFSPEGLTGFDLHGKTLGIIGVGAIGCNVANIGNGFGMNVLAYKRSPDPELEQKYHLKIVDLVTLLQQSDIITIHLPYSPETHHLINEEKFHMMKKGAMLINTARGAIVDTKALAAALESGQIGGAGLDVFEGEPLLHEEKQLLSKEFNKEDMLYVLEEHLLLHHPNVVMTPHNAFNSREALQIIMDTTAENVFAFEKGAAQNVVGEEKH